MTAKNRLDIAGDVTLPVDAVTRTLVVYGGKEMGKSNFGRVLAEELYRNNLRFSFLDPVGTSWGLRYGKDKNQTGLDILILGGQHGDIAIDPRAGRLVAELVAKEEISTLIDFSRTKSGTPWSQGDKIRFVTEYATGLMEFQAQTLNPLMLIVDEAARFAPQTFPSGAADIARCLGALTVLVEEGRHSAVGSTFITQRSARMSKAISELADVMVAFRTIGPNSMEAILDWLGAHVEKEKHKAFTNVLRSLPRGQALVVSPGWLGFEGVAHIRASATYDSSSTPGPGQRRRAPGLAPKRPDLAKYEARMAEVVERTKDSDPAVLRSTIAKLKAEIHSREAELKRAPPPEPPVDLAALSSALSTLNEASKRTAESLEQLTQLVASRQPALAPRGGGVSTLIPSTPPPVSRRAPSPAQNRDDIKLGATARALLIALLQKYPKRVTDSYLAIASGYSIKSSGFANGLSELRTKGFMVGSRTDLQATEEGRAFFPAVDPLPTGEQLLAHWLGKLQATPRAFLQELFKAYPGGLSKEQLAKRSGRSITSSGFANGLSTLRTLRLIDGKDPIRLSSEFFDE